MPSNSDSLYVRLEQEETIEERLSEIKQIIENIEDLSNLIEEADNLKEQSVKEVKENVKKLNQKIDQVDQSLPQDKGRDVKQTTNNQENVEIDDSVGELHSELENLQDELSQFE